MRRVTRVAELREEVAAARREGRRVGFVPTMGALHDGHLSLAREARPRSDLLVVSIFVNPLQFVAGEDLERYPRDLDGDERALGELGSAAPDLVFAPPVDEVYPRPMATEVRVRGLTERLEGASRPGHFDGVTTVVAKLFNLVRPDVAFFGRKDFQQLQVVRRMVADLDVPVDVVGCLTVRDADGLALSSRNAYLDEGERRAALAIPRGLAAAVRAGRAMRSAGRAPEPTALRDAATATLTAESALRIDYVEVVDPETLEPPADGPSLDGSGRNGLQQHLLVAVAAEVGAARLIDNVIVGDNEDEDRLLAATGG